MSIEEGKKFMAALAGRSCEPRGGDIFPLSSGLPGLPHVPAGQGLYDAPDPNRVRHGRGPQSSLGTVPGLLPWHGRRLRTGEGNLPRSSDARVDGTDGTAGKHDAVPAGCDGSGRIPARRADRDACHRAQADHRGSASGSTTRLPRKNDAQGLIKRMIGAS